MSEKSAIYKWRWIGPFFMSVQTMPYSDACLQLSLRLDAHDADLELVLGRVKGFLRYHWRGFPEPDDIPF